MFFWTPGMPPILTLLFFLLGAVFIVYSLAGAFKWTCGWGEDDAAHIDSWECANSQCRSANRRHARFCRMCGKRRDA